MHLPRSTLIGVAAFAGFAAGGSTVYWVLKQKNQLQPLHQGHGALITTPTTMTTTTIQLPDHDHPALKHGIPKSSHVRVFSNFVVEFDSRLRNPRWVLEHINVEKIKGEGNRTNSYFVEDQDIHPRFRSSLSDYRQSGYDRGHMAPAANHKTSQQAMNDTFVLSNISPQIGPGFNQGYWARCERFAQELISQCSDVWIVTGPLYIPQPFSSTSSSNSNSSGNSNSGNSSGNNRNPLTAPNGPRWRMDHLLLGKPPRLVAVPTHYYKVILGEDTTNNTKIIGAFVMPNEPIQPDVPLSAFSVPLSALEEVAGIEFFPNVINDSVRLAIDDASVEWQNTGRMMASIDKQLKNNNSSSSGGGDNSGSVPLLPAPLHSGMTTPGSNSKSKSNSKVVVPQPKPMRVNGLKHICEHNGCRLPPERWWEEGKKRKESSELRRTKSSPAM